MNSRIFAAVLASLVVQASLTVRAQTVLALDFNARSGDTPANTQAGFSSFTMSLASGIQTGPTTRNYGALSVTVNNSGTLGYDDRLRATPTDSGELTESALLRDFIFSRENAGTSGLDVTVTGLTPNSSYRFTIYSFDTSSPGNRVSDWSINGTVVTNGYAFNGSVAPTSNSQYRFSFIANADAGGQVVISGRRNSASVNASGAADLAVFLNALLIELPLPTAPSVLRSPSPVDIFAGDTAILTGVAGGTGPLTYNWLRNGTSVLITASSTLIITNAQLSDAGGYSFIVSNSIGSATSAVAQVTVRAVQNITSGLLSYWPLNDITEIVADVTTNQNSLWPTNMDITNLTDGRAGLALSFNGVDEFLTRTNAPGGTLPASAYPAYTIAMWVNGDGTSQLDRRVFSESSSTNNNPLVTIGTGNPVGTNVVDIFIRNDAGITTINHRKTSLPVFDGTWHHVAWVDNNGFGRVYVDGVLDTNDFNYARSPLAANIDSIGVVYRTNAQALFTGKIDEAATWRRALGPSEISYVMTNGPTVPAGGAPRLGVPSVTATNVTLVFSTANTNIAHHIEQTTNFATNSTVWVEVQGVTFSTVSNIVTARFPRPASQRAFYRVRE